MIRFLRYRINNFNCVVILVTFEYFDNRERVIMPKNTLTINTAVKTMSAKKQISL